MAGYRYEMNHPKLDYLKTFVSKRDPREDYKIHHIIGSGTYGDVYKATRLENNTLAAVKIVKIDLKDDIRAICLEIHTLRDCRHPNIVQYYGSYFRHNKLWICMEFCGGSSMQDIYTNIRRPLEENCIAFVSRETLTGLDYLHKHLKFHRDIKGANILLTDDGRVKLADFGVVAQITQTMNKRNSFIGTPYWMAPEVAAVERKGGYDAKCDIWAVGITAIEYAELQPPMFDLPPLKALHILSLRNYKPPTLQHKSRWSPRFHSFLKFCLTKNEKRRPDAETMLKHEFVAGSHLSERLTQCLLQLHRNPNSVPLIPSDPDEDDSASRQQSSNKKTDAPVHQPLERIQSTRRSNESKPSALEGVRISERILPPETQTEEMLNEELGDYEMVTESMPDNRRENAQSPNDDLSGLLVNGQRQAENHKPISSNNDSSGVSYNRSTGDIVESCSSQLKIQDDSQVIRPTRKLSRDELGDNEVNERVQRMRKNSSDDQLRNVDSQQQPVPAPRLRPVSIQIDNPAKPRPRRPPPPPPRPLSSVNPAAPNLPPPLPPYPPGMAANNQPPQESQPESSQSSQDSTTSQPPMSSQINSQALHQQRVQTGIGLPPTPQVLMGACFTQIFEGCPLKINCTASWVNPQTKGQVILFGTNDGVYYLSLMDLHDSTLELLFPRRCLWLYVVKDTMISLSGQYNQLYTHNLVTLMKLKSQRQTMNTQKLGKLTKILPRRFLPTTKVPDTKGCLKVSITRNPFNGSKYLCAALEKQILVMEWFNPIQTFMELKRVDVPTMPSPLLTFDLLIMKDQNLPLACLGVYKTSEKDRFKLNIVNLNADNSRWFDEPGSPEDELPVVKVVQLEHNTVLICFQDSAKVVSMAGRLKSSRQMASELDFGVNVDSIVCLRDSVLAFHSHGLRGKSFKGQLTQDIDDQKHIYRLLGHDRNIVVENRPSDDPMSNSNVYLLAGHTDSF